MDQWGGIPGQGWTSAWIVDTNGSSVRDKQVRWGEGPTSGDGNYLQFRMKSNGKKGRRWMNYREYGSNGDVNVSSRVLYELLYRPDDSSAFASGGTSFVEIKDGGTLNNNDGATWFIIGYGAEIKRWAFADGNGAGVFDIVRSNMEIVEGNTYKFTVLADPTIDSWGVAVDNLDDDAPAEVFRDLGFINSRSSMAGQLSFLTQVSAIGDETATYSYSIDSIAISAGN